MAMTGRLSGSDPTSRAQLASALKCKSARAVELLCNPLNPAVGVATATMLTAREGAPRYDFRIKRGGDALYAFSAFAHQERGAGEETHYTIRLQTMDETVVGGETFCSKLVCSADGKRYTFNDDPSNFHSWPRELGAAIISGDNFCVLLPRVQSNGAAAQFRVVTPQDSIITRFFAGKAREHLMMLSGPWAPKMGEDVALVHLNTDSQQRGEVLFRAREHGEELLVDFSSPLSAFQAFCIALALIHHAQLARTLISED
ncbi:hypothetical protein AB1Y20_021196 [Prymnesium parvum]|uniref:Tubby C-terminal domain-containing protein n=1 Tax=Prymnesium parvum TaxID=97485 RepID=A0AB34JKW0_PRYPA|mmetsp:Transcript_7736/g.17078  ORF Transcript_7736/g.17078 Transcript_7736/m.17078 type:complete len:258 (+) Transcript_7736:102-875(+)